MIPSAASTAGKILLIDANVVVARRIADALAIESVVVKKER